MYRKHRAKAQDFKVTNQRILALAQVLQNQLSSRQGIIPRDRQKGGLNAAGALSQVSPFYFC